MAGGKLGVELERERAGGVVFQVIERRDAGDDGRGHRAVERAAAAGLGDGDDGGVVGGHDVAILVLFVDHDGIGERVARCHLSVRGRLDDQLGGGAAGMMTTLLDGPARQAAAREAERDGPARLSARPVNVATPPETVAVLVPWSGPLPLASDAVMAVLLSPVSRLPY